MMFLYVRREIEIVDTLNQKKKKIVISFELNASYQLSKKYFSVSHNNVFY